MNILFITADQWRGECLSGLRHPFAKTPNLDGFAGEGVLFRNHYANTAPCAPSRATMHTGMYLHNHRVIQNGTPLDRRHSNWAIESKRAGYRPVLFGYTDTSVDPRGVNPDDPRLRTLEGILPGIEAVAPTLDNPDPWRKHLLGRGYDIAEDADPLSARADGIEYEDGGKYPLPSAYPKEDSDTCFFVDLLMDWLENNGRSGTPWAAHLSLLRPHPPWVAPEPYNQLYDPADMPPPLRAESIEAEAAQHPWLAWKLSGQESSVIDQIRFPQAIGLGVAGNNSKQLQRWKAIYYALIREVDDNLGRLFEFLKQKGLYDSTLIIFTSDHGEQLGDHWLRGKGGYFDASYHVPMILRDPRSQADATRGFVVEDFSEHVDIFPTLLDYLGLERLRQCDGASLRSFVERGVAPARWRKAVHWEQDFRLPDSALAEETLGIERRQCVFNVIRDARYKYVHFSGLPSMLFDVKDEFTDLSGEPACQSLMLEYAGRLLSWRQAHVEHELTDTYLTPQGVFEG